MYKVINETHIQKMPEMEEPSVDKCWYAACHSLGPQRYYLDVYESLKKKYEEYLTSLPTILRGDSGQWKQDQVLQDDEVRVVFDWDLDTSNSCYKRGTTGPNKVAIPAKPKPIETLFKEAMEKAEEQFYGGKSPESRNYKSTWSHGAEWAFNYLLTNKMIK